MFVEGTAFDASKTAVSAFYKNMEMTQEKTMSYSFKSCYYLIIAFRDIFREESEVGQ